MAILNKQLRSEDNLEDIIHPETSAEQVLGLSPVATTGDYNNLENIPNDIVKSSPQNLTDTQKQTARHNINCGNIFMLPLPKIPAKYNTGVSAISQKSDSTNNYEVIDIYVYESNIISDKGSNVPYAPNYGANKMHTRYLSLNTSTYYSNIYILVNVPININNITEFYNYLISIGCDKITYINCRGFCQIDNILHHLMGITANNNNLSFETYSNDGEDVGVVPISDISLNS